MCTHTLLPQPGKPCLAHVALMAMSATCRAEGTHRCVPPLLMSMRFLPCSVSSGLIYPFLGTLMVPCSQDVTILMDTAHSSPGLTDTPVEVRGGFLSNRIGDDKCRLKETENPKAHCPAIVSLAEATRRQQE